MKRAIKYSLLFLIPVLLMSTVVIGQAYWQKSIKNDEAEVEQNLYTVVLQDNAHAVNAATYSGLEYDSAFELPAVTTTGFSGWKYNGTTYEPGYYVYSSFTSASTMSITFVAQY